MKQYYQAQLQNALSATGKIAEFIVGVPGTLDRLLIVAKSPNSSGAGEFDVKVDGASVYSGSLPSLPASTEKLSSVISQVVTEGQLIEVFLATVPSGGYGGPTAVQVRLEDGVTSGGGGGGTAKPSPIYSLDAPPNSFVSPESDYFGSVEESEARWYKFHPEFYELNLDDGMARFVVPSNIGAEAGLLQSLPKGDCTIIIKASMACINADFSSMSIVLAQDGIANPNTSKLMMFSYSRKLIPTIDGQYFTNFSSYGSNINGTYEYAIPDEANWDPMYLRAVRDGTTWKFSYSRNGKRWTDFTQVAMEGTYFSPKEFGIGVVNCVHGNTNTFEFDFIYYQNYPYAQLPGGPVSKAIESAVDKEIVVLGTSIEEGYGVDFLQTWPHQLAVDLGAVSIAVTGIPLTGDTGAEEWRVINWGRNAYTGQNIIGGRIQSVLKLRNPALTRQLVIIGALTNDLALGDSGATAYAKLVSMVGTLQAVGFEVGVCTVMDRNGAGGGFDAARAAHNTLVLANSAGADVVFDLYGNPNLQDASNGTYFKPDELHLKPAGQTEVKNVINAAL